MDFDEQAVGAYGDGCARKRQNFVALARSVAGIHKNREMAAFFYRRELRPDPTCCGKSRRRFERRVRIASHCNCPRKARTPCGHEEFVERGGHAALEKNGFFGAAGALEQGKILHVACADLDHVGVLFNQVERFVVNRFGDYPEPIAAANFRKNLEALFTQTLEAVRGSARLVSAAAEEAHTGFLQALGDGQALSVNAATHPSEIEASLYAVACRVGLSPRRKSLGLNGGF